jgi:hypothetical protein
MGRPPHTVLCPHHNKGSCDRGSTCNQLHDVHGRRSAPGASPSRCPSWCSGRCTSGPNCPYIHDLRYFNTQKITKFDGICLDFLAGSCDAGDACPLAHDSRVDNPPSKLALCMHFRSGSCKRGDSCTHVHDPRGPAFIAKCPYSQAPVDPNSPPFFVPGPAKESQAPFREFPSVLGPESTSTKKTSSSVSCAAPALSSQPTSSREELHRAAADLTALTLHQFRDAPIPLPPPPRKIRE